MSSKQQGTYMFPHQHHHSHPFFGALFTVVTSSIFRCARRQLGDGLRERLGSVAAVHVSEIVVAVVVVDDGGGGIRPALTVFSRATGREMDGGTEAHLSCGTDVRPALGPDACGSGARRFSSFVLVADEAGERNLCSSY